MSESDNAQKRGQHRWFFQNSVILFGIFLTVAAVSFYAGVILRILMLSRSGSTQGPKQAVIISFAKIVDWTAKVKQLPPPTANENEERTEENKNQNQINYEALVQPAMITHPYPKKVMIIESPNEVDTSTSATKREVLKHASVQEAVVVVENGKDTQYEVAGCTVEGGKLFDVIIVVPPMNVLTDQGHSHISTMFNCLEDEGIVSECNQIDSVESCICILYYSLQ